MGDNYSVWLLLRDDGASQKRKHENMLFVRSPFFIEFSNQDLLKTLLQHRFSGRRHGGTTNTISGIVFCSSKLWRLHHFCFHSLLSTRSVVVLIRSSARHSSSLPVPRCLRRRRAAKSEVKNIDRSVIGLRFWSLASRSCSWDSFYDITLRRFWLLFFQFKSGGLLPSSKIRLSSSHEGKCSSEPCIGLSYFIGGYANRIR